MKKRPLAICAGGPKYLHRWDKEILRTKGHSKERVAQWPLCAWDRVSARDRRNSPSSADAGFDSNGDSDRQRSAEITGDF
ncbi:hypothetical protein EPA93_43470 [Ktedonosporobacter rubrisoli]|uniref:Uncharacterized protein n=1 Tax=Ktedonosporobacter rubrisoli TaxID=2509675 RepID=A0A4P6K359_KTERU|nr:hypothetical protein [Ktedonosporobacter rubrisoli]QBD82475.1 hypothetical protein EPA93_43470 [Ktedonosporobacter rubrisoli]